MAILFNLVLLNLAILIVKPCLSIQSNKTTLYFADDSTWDILYRTTRGHDLMQMEDKNRVDHV